MKKFKDILEKSAFGVCEYLGDKIKVAPSRVRLFFIYISFGTLGSPIIIYLFVIFWLNVKKYIRKGKQLIWE